MPTNSYEIRVCDSCGLRYPLVDAYAQTFGTRCPACLGDTRVVLRRKLVVEPGRGHSEAFHHGDARRTKTPGQERRKEERGDFTVLLDNIRSAWNVGSIFRSADGFGFAHAYLCGVTPTPESDSVQKTSLGAEDSVTWSYHKDAVKLTKGLKKEGWQVFALEQDERAVAITDASTAGLDTSAQREVLIVGNEVTGVDPELLGLCDRIYCIPMRGQKRSFNVAIAFAIAASALLDR